MYIGKIYSRFNTWCDECHNWEELNKILQKPNNHKYIFHEKNNIVILNVYAHFMFTEQITVLSYQPVRF